VDEPEAVGQTVTGSRRTPSTLVFSSRWNGLSAANRTRAFSGVIWRRLGLTYVRVRSRSPAVDTC